MYAQKQKDVPFASPLFGSLEGICPLFIQVGSDEVLLSDSQRFAERALASGVEVELEVWPDMMHVWQLASALLPEGKEALQNIAAYIQKHKSL